MKFPPPDASHNHTLAIREVSGQGGNIFGHITAQLDNRDELGFAPVGTDALTVYQVLHNIPVPGHLEPRAAKVKTKDAVTIYLTEGEVSHAQAVLDNWTSNPGYYLLDGRSCVDFAEAVLAATGFTAPAATLPVSLPKDIRAEQIKYNTVQVP